MSSLNKVQLIARLGKDPEARGSATTMTVATSESWKDKQTGEKQEKTEWHNVVCFGRLAEISAQFLKKGSLAYFEGRLQTEKYTDKSGVEKYSTKIVCDQMKMISSPKDVEQTGEIHPVDKQKEVWDNRLNKSESGLLGGTTPVYAEDDIPF